MKRSYDLVVIGSGPAGHSAALKAAARGFKVALIEKNDEHIGGVCLNEGCIPVKSLLHSAGLYGAVKKTPGMFMPRVSLTPDIDFFTEAAVNAKERLKKGLKHVLAKNKIDLIYGKAFIEAGSLKKVKVFGPETLILKSENIIVATGSRPKSLPDLVPDGKVILNSSHAIKISDIPGNVLVVGAGAIGVEFASFLNSIGAEVTLAEIADSILPFEDREITGRLASLLRKTGIKVITGIGSFDIKVSGNAARVDMHKDKDTETFTFDKVLLAVGREPVTAEVGLEQANIVIDDKGFVSVNDELMTNIPGIFAAGDVIDSPMLAHTAAMEGEYIAHVLSGSKIPALDYTNVPNAVYSDIEVASVGYTEEQCKKKGMEYIQAKYFFMANGRAVACNESDGFVKVLVSKKDRSILGAHILGSKSAELIHEFVLARRNGLTVDAIANTVHAHPTFSETIMEACRSL